MSLFSDAQKAISGGFGRSISGIVSDAIPSSVKNSIGTGVGVINDIQSGNLISATQRALNGIGGKFGSNPFNTQTAMLGGISPAEALNIYNRQRGIQWCRKNLWMIEVSSSKGDNELFNMFCFNVDFSPFTITGEKKQIGSAHVDIVNSSDPVELTLTTLDDVNGSIKRWFEDHATECAASDGTVGVPDDYAIKIKVIHGFITAGSNSGGYESKGIFRTGNIQLSLSRSEQALSELTMSFVQLDTFMGY